MHWLQPGERCPSAPSVSDVGEPHAVTVVDPDDTRGCPTLPACDGCGAVDDLAVGTGETPLGIACLTLCGSCAEAGDTPRWTVGEALRRVLGHAEHLGCTVDALAARPGAGGAR